jgi:hypothetical protein
MTGSRDIGALQELASLILDSQLTGLRLAAGRREQSLMQIAALDRPAAPTDLAPAAAAQVALRHQLWAGVRRTELNTVLARQTAEWMAAQEEARRAFGKVEALRGIAARLAEKR